MRRNRFWLVALVLALVLTLVPVKHIAWADSVIVNSDTDNSDGDTSSIANLIASPGPDGVISLREAIEAANNTPGSDTINFNCGGACNIQLDNALPDLTDDATIIDGSDTDVTLDGSNLTGYINGLFINGASYVQIRGLQILHFPGSGIRLENASHNIIGGTNPGPGCTGDCNLISDNDDRGVEIDGDSTYNTVSGNYIGTNADGTAALGNGSRGVTISEGASHNTIGGGTSGPGGYCTGECNLISGNGSPDEYDYGVRIYGSGTTGNIVRGNYIGTNADGTAAIPNTYTGVSIKWAPDNVIEYNLISGNSHHGVDIWREGADRNRVRGNYIGTDASGTAALGNGTIGVWISIDAQYNVIGGENYSPGGTCTGECNLISGNNGLGVLIETSSSTMNNTVSGNYIGTDADGIAAIPNNGHGVEIRDAVSYNVIGGNTPGERNLISGNGHNGVRIHGDGTTNNTVSGNYIGTNVSGMAAIGNTEAGVRISGGAQYNVIGGSNVSPGDSCSGDCNLISGNGGSGVNIQYSGHNTAIGNHIGMDAAGTSGLGNHKDGVLVGGDAQQNTIGPANTIAYNGRFGVLVVGEFGTICLRNTITHNSIYSNMRKGIGLYYGGNTELPPPVITTVDLNSGLVGGTACALCTVEVFSDNEDEGQVFEGSTTADGSGNFTFNKPGLTGPHTTATATDVGGNTSEFSTVQEAIALIIDEVEELVDTETLNTGQGNSLIQKLENAIKKLNQGNTNAAINILEAFIRQVNDLINEGVLSSEEGQSLIDATNSIIDSLSRGQ